MVTIGALYWESVLTGRRLILLTIHTFASDSMVRFVCLNCACLLILVHHLTLRPFRDRKANIFESLSLVSLVAICTFRGHLFLRGNRTHRTQSNPFPRSAVDRDRSAQPSSNCSVHSCNVCCIIPSAPFDVSLHQVASTCTLFLCNAVQMLRSRSISASFIDVAAALTSVGLRSTAFRYINLL